MAELDSTQIEIFYPSKKTQVVHTSNSSSWKYSAYQVGGQPGLHNETLPPKNKHADKQHSESK